MDASCPEQQDLPDDEIICEVFKVALGDEISTGCSYGKAMWARDADLPMVAADAPQSESPTAAEPKQGTVDPDDPYLCLWKIDHDLLAHAKRVKELILKSEKLAIAQAPHLEMAAEEDWMLSARQDVAKITAVGDMAPIDLRAAMLDNIDKQLQTIQKWQENIAKPGPAFDTEAAIKQRLEWGQKDVMSDISDASGLFDVLNEDGIPFVLGSTKPSDLQLVWNISVDFFNPFLNKAAGKSVSTGSIVLSCPLLPPSI
ncbi:hypothetical protein EWM64_g3815 [Hericium alpestre]|uniref:Uncharacterized protein n=1 Tax=Hericium alpestre TaxID=135208 RepID=A0A4Z0A2V1_9AGAM|nr:hypothetical protein EWM64_g3815 [Hericium alpestre]